MDLYKALKPNKDGNDLLWLLHEADIIDKHRGLIPAYSQVGTTIIDAAASFRFMASQFPGLQLDAVPSMLLGINWAEPACPVEDGTELWRVRAGQRAQVDMNPKFTFTIAFGETQVLKAKPIVPTLHQFARMVEGIAKQFLDAGLLA